MKCPKCKRIFTETEVLRKHIRLFHGIRDGEIIVCTESNCFQIFTKVFNFVRHCKICHNINKAHKDSRIISINSLKTNDFETETTCVEKCVEESTHSSTHTVHSYDINDSVEQNTIERVVKEAGQHCIDLLAQPNISVTTAVSNIEKTSDVLSHCILYLKQRVKDTLMENIPSSVEHNNLLQEFDTLKGIK